MSSTASANSARDTAKKKKADADPVNNPVFDDGAEGDALFTANPEFMDSGLLEDEPVGTLRSGGVRPRSRSDIQGAAEFNEKSIIGKIRNDLAMGLGMKPKDDSFDFRTSASRIRSAGDIAPAPGDAGYESRADQRASLPTPTAAPAAAGTAAAAGSTTVVPTPTPPDPDTIEMGAAETAVIGADAASTATPIPKLGRKSTIATSNQGISDEPEPEPEPEPAITASKPKRADRASTVATSSQGLLSKTQPSLRRRRSLMGMIK